VTTFGRAAVLALLGVVVARLVWSGSFALYVQNRMLVPLAVAAAVLVALALHQAVTAEGGRGRRRAGPLVGWLLIVPVLVLVAVDPGGLGASAAKRRESVELPRREGLYQPLPATDPLPMRVVDFVDRALYDADGTLRGRRVELEGLVVNDPRRADGFALTRFVVSCCAADGVPVQVWIDPAPAPLADDTWVRVVGTWVPDGDEVVVRPETVTVVPEAPLSAYESPY
jgi:uncharacterized repeat protein (TIGR03943 family)